MKTSLQTLIRFAILIVLIHTLNHSFGQVGINNPTPNASSMLDITSTNKGVLIPRMSSAQRLAIPTPGTGLMVYETTTNQFFYFDGTVWKPFSSSVQGWNVTGNAATVAGTNFIGTTDAVDIVTKTNNTEKMRVTSGGNVGIGTATPTSLSNYTSLCVNNPVNGGVIDLMTNGVYKMRLANTSSSAVIETNTGIPLIFSPHLTEAMRVSPNGNVGIGTTTPLVRLHVDNGTDATLSSTSGFLLIGNPATENLILDENEIIARTNGVGSDLFFQASGGEGVKIGGGTPTTFQFELTQNSAAKPTSNVWTVTSDARLKTNVHDYTEGISTLNKIHPVWFTYTGEAGMPKETGIGVIAQELKEVAPFMVGNWAYTDTTGKKTDYLNVDNGAMTYMLINSVKELNTMVEELKAEQKMNSTGDLATILQELKTENEQLLKRIQEIEKLNMK